MITIDNDHQSPDLIGAWHFLNWLLVLACPRMFHQMVRRPTREHMLKLLNDYLPYARSERQQYFWKYGSRFEVDRERRQMLAGRLQKLFMEWSHPELTPEITEIARALLDTEGNDPPPGGWGKLQDPDVPPEEILLWPEGMAGIAKAIPKLPTPREQQFPADIPRSAPSTSVSAEPLWPAAERIAGKVYVEPRPALRQGLASSVLGGLLVRPFQLGAGGPGGWVIFDKPELHLGDDILVPDLAAWRAERAPNPGDEPATAIVPDWICEILSPSRSTSAQVAKMHAYAREGLRYAWLLDPFDRTLQVLKLNEERQWLMLAGFGAFMGHTHIRAVPFNAIEIDLALLWPKGMSPCSPQTPSGP